MYKHECLIPRQLAEIIFEGNRVHGSHNLRYEKVAEKGKLSKLFERMHNFVESCRVPEDTDDNNKVISLRSAEKYLSDIGYSDRQIGIFRNVVSNIVSAEIKKYDAEDNTLDFDGNPRRFVPHPEYSDRFFLGAHYGEQKLPDVDTMSESFSTEVKRIWRTSAGLLITHYDVLPFWRKTPAPADPV